MEGAQSFLFTEYKYVSIFMVSGGLSTAFYAQNCDRPALPA